MSGAASNFTDGYLQDRARANLVRKDLDLWELIELCSKPESQEERIAEVQRYASVYPELKYFLVVAYFCKDAFTQVNQKGPIEFTPSRVPRGGSSENIRSMWKEVCRIYDTFPTGPSTKRGIAYRLLTSLYKEDAALIQQLIEGKFYRKELNEEVVRKAFPKETPQDPKA